jgi:hypothetical protein
MTRAANALGKVDMQDMPYLACGLAIEADAIWSHGQHFDSQDLIPRIPHPNATSKPPCLAAEVQKIGVPPAVPSKRSLASVENVELQRKAARRGGSSDDCRAKQAA